MISPVIGALMPQRTKLAWANIEATRQLKISLGCKLSDSMWHRGTVTLSCQAALTEYLGRFLSSNKHTDTNGPVQSKLCTDEFPNSIK